MFHRLKTHSHSRLYLFKYLPNSISPYCLDGLQLFRLFPNINQCQNTFINNATISMNDRIVLSDVLHLFGVVSSRNVLRITQMDSYSRRQSPVSSSSSTKQICHRGDKRAIEQVRLALISWT